VSNGLRRLLVLLGKRWRASQPQEGTIWTVVFFGWTVASDPRHSVRPLGDTTVIESYWGVGAIRMTIQEQRHADHDDDVITEVSEEEFREAAYAALDRLGLTYAQLRDMARRREFTSAQAQSLWVSIGGALDL